MFKWNSYKVNDWRVWFVTSLGFIVSLLLFFIILQPTRVWFLEPQSHQAYLSMLKTHKDEVLVYVIDSGVETSVDEWLTKNSVVGYDAINDTLGGNEDCTGHGTRVASVLGRNIDTDNATIVPVKTAECSSVNDPAAIIRGLNWIVDNHPKDAPIGVINMSFGYIDNIPFLDGIQNAVQSALDAGFVIVASAGNNSKVDAFHGDEVVDACHEVPANVDGVITVGAASLSFAEGNVQRAGFSNSGSCVTLFAEGTSVMASMKDKSGEVVSGYVSGTSFAAPYVSAAVANKLVVSPWLERDALTESIKADAVKDVIVSRVASPLEPNVDIVGDGSTPNLFLEYNFDDYKSFLQSYSDYSKDISYFTP